MKFLNNISVRAKLLIISVPLAVALFFSVIFMAIEINGTEEEVTDMYYNILYTVNSNLINADRDFYQAILAATQYHDAKEAGNESVDFAGLLDDYKTNAQQVVDNMQAAADAAKANDMLYNDMKGASGKTFAVSDQGFEDGFAKWQGLYDLSTQSGDWDQFMAVFESTRDEINELQEITEAWALEEHELVKNGIRGKVASISIFFIILILILGLIVIAVIRGIRLGIAGVTRDLDELARGNLTIQLPDVSSLGRDDIGRIQKSAITLTEKLREVMQQSNTMSHELNNASVDLADSASQASQASDQVTDAVTEISKGAVAQAESVETAVSNTDDIGRNIENITGDVKEMDSVAGEMKEACDKAMKSLEMLIRQSEEVTVSVKDIGNTINSTNESAKTISEFTQAITDIATQTNLLSLNASIEAARAGDAGRGFAVVADEIRQLADQSSDSADKIKSIVERLLADSASSVSVLEKLNESFEEQAVQLDSTKANMVTMSGNVESVKDTSAHISGRIVSLNEAKNGLMEIISDLSAISEENAASTEETNASMEELNATFTIISESAGKLQNLAKDLGDTISYFKV